MMGSFFNTRPFLMAVVPRSPGRRPGARSAHRVVGIGSRLAGSLGRPGFQIRNGVDHAAAELAESRPAADHALLLQRAR